MALKIARTKKYCSRCPEIIFKGYLYSQQRRNKVLCEKCTEDKPKKSVNLSFISMLLNKLK